MSHRSFFAFSSPAGQSLSTPALLVLARTPEPAPGVEIRHANDRAQQLLNLPMPLVGARLEQLPLPLSSPELFEQLRKGPQTRTSLAFQLQWHPPAGPEPLTLEGQLLFVDNDQWVLALTPLAHLPVQPDPLTLLLEELPVGLMRWEALRNTNGEVVDFQARLFNQRAARLMGLSVDTLLCFPISQHIPTHDLHPRCVQVLATGEPAQYRLSRPAQSLGLEISIRKYGADLLVTFQDGTPGLQTTPLLERIMSSSPASVRYYEAIRDGSGKIVDFLTGIGNELAAYRPFRPMDSTTGQRLLALYPHLSDNGLFERYVTVVETGQSDFFETSMQLGDRPVWLDCRAVPHGDGFVLTTLDISVQKQAQQNLQQQAGLLQTVLDSSLTGIAWLIALYSAPGQLVDFSLQKINATLAQTLGQTPHALEGRRLSEVMPHQMTNGLFERYAAVARTHHPQRFEWSNADGTIWYDVSAVAVADGVIVTFMDITGLKLAQLDLQRQTNLVQGVFNSSESSIVVLKPIGSPAEWTDFQVTLANPKTLHLFSPFLGLDLTLEDFRQKPLSRLFPAFKSRALFTALTRVVTTGQPIHTPIDYPELSVTYDYAITPFQDGVLMITTDITPLRRYQQQLEEKNQELSRSNQYLEQFAYMASHDLQEPLRKIVAFGSLLQSQYSTALDSLGQDLLNRQLQAAVRMQSLVKDLLAYSRLTGTLPPFTAVPLTPILQEILEDLETTIQQSGAQLQVSSLPVVWGNATQLRQLMQNLLTNALKFNHPGRPPRVHIDGVIIPGEQLPQPVAGSTPWVALRVSDEGIGFNEAYRERIFDLFQRLHGRSAYAGTGIGLAIVKKVVENHHGQITAHSPPGEGATFRVYLPLARADE
ncbi:ATP-binding protein [Larkinella insperata]|uniref:histidine kinase n=1 Tax=Larkinella insperata TaxID=332158 RepID=A0ABW3Q8W7_9BACT